MVTAGDTPLFDYAPFFEVFDDNLVREVQGHAGVLDSFSG